MSLFTSFGGKLDYRDILQVDGAFYSAHVKYGKTPIFNGKNVKAAIRTPEKRRLPSEGHPGDYGERNELLDGTNRDPKKADQVELWKNYWLEYANAFDKLAASLPESVVTAFVGRQAIEIGMKFILLNSIGQFPKVHDLGELSEKLFSELAITESYMDWICTFCKQYCEHVEGGNAEYFRFPQYKRNAFFGGDSLDIEWLSYNFALMLLKLIHFANLEEEIGGR